jgi:hypothetical protein
MSTLTEKALAKRWDITPRTLQMWRNKGIGPLFIRIGKRSVFYRTEDVLAYEKAHVVGKPIAPDGWDTTVKRAAAALDLLASKAAKPEGQKTLSGLCSELRGLIS